MASARGYGRDKGLASDQLQSAVAAPRLPAAYRSCLPSTCDEYEIRAGRTPASAVYSDAQNE